MIQIQRLEGFYWVARTEGYARAARAFPYPITQPGVHQQVKRLEQELGVELFERVGKDRVVLTPAGRLLYEHVAPFLESLPALLTSVRGGELTGSLRIAASGLVLRYVLPPWVRRLQKQRSGLHVSLIETKTADLDLLRRGDTDLLVDYISAKSDDLELRKIAEAHVYLVLPSNHAQAHKATAKIADLKGDPFIGYNADREMQLLQLKALGLHGGPDRASHVADSAETILGFVAAGVGFSLVPSLLPTGPKFPGVVAHRLNVPGSTFAISVAWRKSAAKNPFIQAALEAAPEVEK